MSSTPTVSSFVPSSPDGQPGMPRVIEGGERLRRPGSRLARGLLRLFGWRLVYSGLPARQGVIMVYPHTSNWDFVIGVLAKWGLGLELKFWGKDSLFKLPVFGSWVRWIGGIPVERSSANGVVADTVAQVRAAQQRQQIFWLALAPEGTRSRTDGWRSGAYHVAVQAGIPVGLAYFDFERRVVDLTHFVQLCGQPERDFAHFAQYLAPVKGKRPDQASPITLKGSKR
ncbi:1-acyl-sn-glycerol-3-phosphate acyltransferase [Pelomonas sp. APW6]|uniref:1-acyl-sn-glycerol-3-phosphate acyltransferase n=1 Tax=Roseateles subflavus TaxID=3053353 RepID=A0ABT7LLB9_9BURK|nr:1-acyl-sn-glycerol-3-phosphate acyltransferase [Pelomonas sp. APW6]MDL5033668.1 1-acyl-sn-glycerol-3-phosphate acyltransferase [Pelomonas sp. APW6]